MQNNIEHPNAIRKIGILGGGSAGYLTALALHRQFPDLEITLIASSKIPVIGVGESTSDILLRLLHETIGISIEEFHRRVKPTWKMGIRFYWGRPAPYYFNNTLLKDHFLDAHYALGNVNAATLASFLMDAERTMLIKTNDQERPYKALTHLAPFTYHFDNVTFIRFLQEKAREMGINTLDTTIVQVEKTPDGDRIDHLLDENGESLCYDLYLDCSGFRSELIGKSMGSPRISYRDRLFTDTALLAAAPNQGTPKPFSVTSTMDAGWQWNIPIMEDEHLGYVFSSSHCSEEKAREEFLAKNPQVKEVRKVINFGSHRHAHFWKGNVVALGNAYGFLDPLQGVSIHLLVKGIEALIKHFPISKRDVSSKDHLNEVIGAQWDFGCDLLALPFRFNRRLETPFWRYCQEKTPLPILEEYIQTFQERGPFSELPRVIRDFLFHPEKRQDLIGIPYVDMIFLGIACLNPGPIRYDDLEGVKASLQEKARTWKAIAAQALDMRTALDLIDRQPHLIDFDSFSRNSPAVPLDFLVR